MRSWTVGCTRVTHPGVCVHQPHGASRGAGEVAGQLDGEAAPAAHADHLRHQLALPSGERPKRHAQSDICLFQCPMGRRSWVLGCIQSGSCREEGIAISSAAISQRLCFRLYTDLLSSS